MAQAKIIVDEQTGQPFAVLPERWFDVVSAWISAFYSLAVISYLAYVVLDTWSGQYKLWPDALTGQLDKTISANVFKLIVYTAVGGGMGAAVNNLRSFGQLARRAQGVWLAFYLSTARVAPRGGNEMYFPTTKVPDLSGKSVDEAKKALADAKLRIGDTTEQPTDPATIGKVVAQDPLAGTEIACDSAVNITVGVSSDKGAPAADEIKKNGQPVAPVETPAVPAGDGQQPGAETPTVPATGQPAEVAAAAAGQVASVEAAAASATGTTDVSTPNGGQT